MRLIIHIAFAFMLYACQTNCEKYDGEIYVEPSFEAQISPESKANFLKNLERWEEPKLEELGYESYRLFVVRAFPEDTNHIIRIEKNATEIKLTHKRSISPFDSTMTIINEEAIILSTEQWEKFEKMIYSANFWTLPIEVDRRGFDGSLWDLEGFRPAAAKCGKRTHHGVSRWSPEKGAYRDLCEELFKLSEK